MGNLDNKTVDPNRRLARCSVERLEDRALLSMGVTFSDSAVRPLNDKVGSVVVTLVASNNDANTATTPISVNLTTSGVTAVPGVDYSSVQETVNFAAGETSKQVQLPILPGDPSLGSRTVKISISPTPADPAGANEYVVVQHGTDTVAPQILNAKALTKAGKVAAFTITFSKDMALGPVQNVWNYAIGDPTSIKFNSSLQSAGTTKTIPLKSATYNPATHTVVLVPAVKVKSFPFFTIMDPAANQMWQSFNLGNPLDPATFPNTISNLTDRTGNPITTIYSNSSPNEINGTFSVQASGGKLGQSIIDMISGTTTPKTKPAPKIAKHHR